MTLFRLQDDLNDDLDDDDDFEDEDDSPAEDGDDKEEEDDDEDLDEEDDVETWQVSEPSSILLEVGLSLTSGLNLPRLAKIFCLSLRMPTGTIARLLIDKGFGFVRDEGGTEYFFHRSSVRQQVFELLREGQRVEFTVEESQKGPRAGDVRLIES